MVAVGAGSWPETLLSTVPAWDRKVQVLVLAEYRRLAWVWERVLEPSTEAQTRMGIAGHRAPMYLEAVTAKTVSTARWTAARTVGTAVAGIEAADSELLWYARMKGR